MSRRGQSGADRRGRSFRVTPFVNDSRAHYVPDPRYNPWSPNAQPLPSSRRHGDDRSYHNSKRNHYQNDREASSSRCDRIPQSETRRHETGQYDPRSTEFRPRNNSRSSSTGKSKHPSSSYGEVQEKQCSNDRNDKKEDRKPSSSKTNVKVEPPSIKTEPGRSRKRSPSRNNADKQDIKPDIKKIKLEPEVEKVKKTKKQIVILTSSEDEEEKDSVAAANPLLMNVTPAIKTERTDQELSWTDLETPPNPLPVSTSVNPPPTKQHLKKFSNKVKKGSV